VDLTDSRRCEREQLRDRDFLKEEPVFRKLTTYDHLLGVAEYLETNRTKGHARVKAILDGVRISHVAKRRLIPFPNARSVASKLSECCF
jgi:ABC-type lipopolysaccharide export system ATPase subunit